MSHISQSSIANASNVSDSKQTSVHKLVNGTHEEEQMEQQMDTQKQDSEGHMSNQSAQDHFVQ